MDTDRHRVCASGVGPYQSLNKDLPGGGRRPPAPEPPVGTAPPPESLSRAARHPAG